MDRRGFFKALFGAGAAAGAVISKVVPALPAPHVTGITGEEVLPRFELASLPLPIIHSDFHFTARRLVNREDWSWLDREYVERRSREITDRIEQELVCGKL